MLKSAATAATLLAAPTVLRAQSGGKIKLVQIYTVARRPTESYVTPLTDAEVDRLTALVREKTGLPAAPFYGSMVAD